VALAEEHTIDKGVETGDDTRFDDMSRTLGASLSRRQALKLLGAGAAGSIALATGLRTTTAQSGSLIPITGTLLEEPFEGALQVTSFFAQGGELLANVNLLNEAGAIIGEFVATVIPRQQSCQILRLELAPLELDLLGLVIEPPNPLILEIRAEPGPGNLLGNLLCAVAGLLDRGGPLQGIARLLNRILAVLG
jgi:hypothetical protein